MAKEFGKDIKNPYRIFFSVGLGYALLGALVWILFNFQQLGYPGHAHSVAMVLGFLLSFITGFVLTATVHFTGSFPARRWEVGLALLLLLTPALTLAGAFPSGSEFASTAALLLFLIVYALRRLDVGKYTPPPLFLLVIAGLALGGIGAALLAATGFGFIVLGNGTTAARAFLFQGLVLGPILGIGSRLMSMMLGWGQSQVIQIGRIGASERERQGAIVEGIGLAVLYVLAFVAEFWAPLAIPGRLLRAAITSWVGFRYWHLQRKPKTRTLFARCLWVSAWSLVVGLWWYALAPGMAVHALHLVFVSGFGMVTLLVASRVTLSHGGYDVDSGLRSRVITAMGILLGLAAVTRVTAIWVGSAYFHHLAYAALLWILGVGVWMFRFFPKLVRLNRKT